MPQLDFSNPLLMTQVLWLLVIFGALYYLLSTIALPPVAKVLAEREAAITADLDAARAAKGRADEAIAELERAIAKARTDGQAAIRVSVEAAKIDAAKAEAESNARLGADLAAAEARITGAKNAALAGLGQVASEAASAVAERLTGMSPDPVSVDQAVSDVMAARGSRG